MASIVRQNFHEACEAAINKQINMELYASYVYLSLSHHYERDDISLPGIAKFMKKSSDEERAHAEKFMEYQNSRGGRIRLLPVSAPARQEWGNLLEGLQTALDLEKQVNQSILDLHGKADEYKDPHLGGFLEEHFITEQVEAIKMLADFITRAKRAGTGLGEHIFDKELADA